MACRKLAFSTVEQAERTRAIIHALRGGAGKTPVRLYECPRCGDLHFTSKEEKEILNASTVEHLDPLPLSPPPLPPPPEVSGPFAKVVLPGKQPWVREKETHRPSAKVLATRVVDAVPPILQPKPPQPRPQLKKSGHERHLAQLNEISTIRNAREDALWFKGVIERARQLIRKEGRVFDACLLLDAAASFKRSFSPTEDPTVTERELNTRIERERAYVLSDPLRNAGCVPLQAFAPYPASACEPPSNPAPATTATNPPPTSSLPPASQSEDA